MSKNYENADRETMIYGAKHQLIQPKHWYWGNNGLMMRTQIDEEIPIIHSLDC